MSDEKLPVSTTPLPDAGPIDSHVGGGGGGGVMKSRP